MSKDRKNTAEQIVIRRETPGDFRAVEELVRDAFWNVYHPGCTEHYILHCFRDQPAFIPELDLLMEKDGRLIGQVMYVHSEIVREDGRTLPAVTFGPVSILPGEQRKGYGKRLVDFSVEEAAALGYGAVCITGNPAFYGTCGFAAAKERGIVYAEDPGAAYFLVRELKKGYLDGVRGTFRDPEGYLAAEEHPEAFAAFDGTFPAREKKVLPGQPAQ